MAKQSRRTVTSIPPPGYTEPLTGSSQGKTTEPSSSTPFSLLDDSNNTNDVVVAGGTPGLGGIPSSIPSSDNHRATTTTIIRELKRAPLQLDLQIDDKKGILRNCQGNDAAIIIHHRPNNDADAANDIVRNGVPPRDADDNQTHHCEDGNVPMMSRKKEGNTVAAPNSTSDAKDISGHWASGDCAPNSTMLSSLPNIGFDGASSSIVFGSEETKSGEVVSVNRRCKSPSKAVAMLPKNRHRDEHTHIFTASLLELLCMLYEPKKSKRKAMFNSICTQLTRRNVISEVVLHEVYSELRHQYIDSFVSLIEATMAMNQKNPLGTGGGTHRFAITDAQLHRLIPRYTRQKSIEAPIKPKMNFDHDTFTSRYGKEFEEIKSIGKGGFGSVFEVQNKLDGCNYAVKKIRLKQLSVRKCDMILREVKLLASLSHMSVVRYNNAWLERQKEGVRIRNLSEGPFSSSDDDDDSSDSNNGPLQSAIEGVLHIQMELCKTNLDKWLSQRNENLFKHHFKDVYHHLREAENMQFTRELLNGLDYIHSKGVIHRDIKPKNIFIHPNGALKIGDFGLARENIATPSPTNETALVAWPQIEYDVDLHLSQGVGTSFYTSPEQRNSSHYDNKSDVYSAGIIAFELFCPFNTVTEKHILIEDFKKKGCVPDQLKDLWPKQIAMLLKMISKNPIDRPSASELLLSDLYVDKDHVIRHLEARVEDLENEKEHLLEMVKITSEEYAVYVSWKKQHHTN